MDEARAVFDAINRIGRLTRDAADDWVRERGLTASQGVMLGFLVEHPGAIQRDLAAMSGTSSANVTGIVRVLERRGLIERRSTADDERIKRVYATAEGAELVEGFEEAMAAVRHELLMLLDAKDRHRLLTLLHRLAESLPRPD